MARRKRRRHRNSGALAVTTTTARVTSIASTGSTLITCAVTYSDGQIDVQTFTLAVEV